MPSRTFIVTGTDTGIGKTVFAASLTAALNASYWKPVQSGLDEATDSQNIQYLAQLSPERILPEAYRLKLAASPHLAAAQENITITLDRLALPSTENDLVIEGAGGVLVPLNETQVYADAFQLWNAPVILCARTSLGTINHTLLSLEALRSRNINVLGIAFIGDENRDTQRIIATLGHVKILGRLPLISPLTPENLASAFKAAFSLDDFTQGTAL